MRTVRNLGTIAAGLLLVALSSPACGSDAAPLQPAAVASAMPPDIPPPISTALAAPAAVACPPACPAALPFTGYWIVSTRRCPQSFCAGDPCCHFDYYHVGPDYAVRNVPAAAFYSALQPCVPLCVAVHGGLFGWEDVYLETPRIESWLRHAAPHRPLQIVFFTWPSDNVPVVLCPQLEFGILGRRAEYNGFYLAQFLSQVPCDTPLSLLGHSYGARMIASALHLFGGGEVFGRRLAHQGGIGHRTRVVFAAAGIDHHWLNPGDRFGAALSQTEALLNMVNHKDLALHFYPLQRWFADCALGEEGFRRSDLEAIGWQAAKISELDVTHLIGFGHAWVHYYSQPSIARAIVPWIYFDEPGIAAPLPHPAAAPQHSGAALPPGPSLERAPVPARN